MAAETLYNLYSSLIKIVYGTINQSSIPPAPSEEQKNIIQALAKNHIKVNAVAGSGKTTTCLHIAKSFPNSKILLLTYNRKLKEETRTRVESDESINNIVVENYHSLAQKIFGMTGYTDHSIHEINARMEETPQIFSILPYDIIILDEVQDLRLHYYKLIVRLLSMTKPTIRLCVLGDVYQNIYSYDQSDPRYLTMAHQIYNYHPNASPFDWIELPLSVTFRLTKPTCDFVNRFLGIPNYIKSSKPGPKPQYYCLNLFSSNGLNALITTIENLLYTYTPNDIFILARSINIRTSKNPLKQLTNKLSAKKIPVYMPQRDEEKLSADDINGKISIITFHQSKGLERKNVIIWGFDSYSYKGDADKNTYYVALTRSLLNIILVQSKSSRLIPPFTKSDIEELTELKTPLVISKSDGDGDEVKEQAGPPVHIGITDLLRHLNSTIEYSLSKQLVWECMSPPTRELDIPMYVDSKVPDSQENISEYNGSIIPYYYEYIRSGGIFPSLEPAISKFLSIEPQHKQQNIVTEDGQLNTEKIVSMVRKNIETFKRDYKSEHHSASSISNLLRAIVLWNSLRNNIIYKYYQIKQFTWISNDALRAAYHRLHQHVQQQNFLTEQHYQIEVKLRTRYKDKIVSGFYIHGYIDAITQSPNQTTIWEFKTTKTITEIHKLQLALYAYLFLSSNPRAHNRRYLLYNIYTDELLELKTTNLTILANIFNEILYAHINRDPNQSPPEIFLDTCRQVIEAVKTQKSTAEINPPPSKPIKHDKSILKSFENF